jgi:hypothetical protein
MDSLNPGWLRIEVESIETAVEAWSGALRASYEAAMHSMTTALSVGEAGGPSGSAAGKADRED